MKQRSQRSPKPCDGQGNPLSLQPLLSIPRGCRTAGDQDMDHAAVAQPTENCLCEGGQADEAQARRHHRIYRAELARGYLV
jgi:hypothetical protein